MCQYKAHKGHNELMMVLVVLVSNSLLLILFFLMLSLLFFWLNKLTSMRIPSMAMVPMH